MVSTASSGEWNSHRFEFALTLLFPRLGPANLTIYALHPKRSSAIPTVTDNLYEQGSIPSNLVAISFEPTTSKSVVNGEMMFGAIDPNKFNGSITKM